MHRPLLAFCSLAAVFAGSAARAADPAVVYKAPPPVMIRSPWQFEIGARYWFSSGNHQFDLFDPFLTSQLNSRLTFGDLTGHSAETFFRIDHETGFFLKGFIGGGAIASGKLNDEDTPAALGGPFSNTISVQSGGSLKYATVDFGYNVIQTVLPTGQPIRIGPFVGYNHFHQRINTFGCSQVGANPGICGTIPPFLTPIPTSFDALDADASWNSIRAGVGGEIVLLPGVRASLEAAWIHSWLWNTDYHNFRPDIRAMQQSGDGDGFQLEGLLSYDLTPRFSVGIGGRYWQFNAQGKNHWERKLAGALFGIPSAPLNTFSERYGFFLQAGYRFGGPNDPTGAGAFGPMFGKAEIEPHVWSGVYVGGHVGYGFGDTGLTTFSAVTPQAAIFQASGVAPFSQRSDVAGFVGGGQIGYNWQVHPLVVAGVETDIAYANIGGSFADSHLFTGLTTSSKRLLEWLGTVRGRVGFLLRDDVMLYGTGGFAYGGVSAQGAFGTVGVVCTLVHCSTSAFSDIATGWTAGAGLEYAIARNWSLKGEWLYVDLGRQNYGINSFGGAIPAGVPASFAASSDSATHIIRTGLNYRIEWPAAEPVVAKY